MTGNNNMNIIRNIQIIAESCLGSLLFNLKYNGFTKYAKINAEINAKMKDFIMKNARIIRINMTAHKIDCLSFSFSFDSIYLLM